MEQTNTVAFGKTFQDLETVSSEYFTGKVTSTDRDANGVEYCVIEIEDKDERINGKSIPVYVAQLKKGTTTEYDRNVEYIKSRPDTTSRERTYGEYVVGLNLDRSGVDSNLDVYTWKAMCAQMIDQLKIIIGKGEKELMILTCDTQVETYKIVSMTNSLDQYKAAIDKIIKLKSRLVSAAIENNDKGI